MLNYSTNILISTKQNNRKQLIYASQSYGTFFCVFATFICNTKNEITKIDFELKNYKGLLNLCIEDISIDTEATTQIEGTDTKTVIIDLKVRAAVTAKIYTGSGKDPRYTFELNSITSQTKPADFTPFTPGKLDVLMVRRELIALNGNDGDAHRSHGETDSPETANGIFDSEFYFRNGEAKVARDVGDFKTMKKNTDDVVTLTSSLVEVRSAKTCKIALAHFIVQ